MSELNKPNNLTDWQGGVDSLIVEMKRRAGVGTDVELATFVGVTQGAVANWRRRGAVPESALLGFDRISSRELDRSSVRAVLARALAMRLAHRDAETNNEDGASISVASVYLRHSGQLDIVADECFEILEDIEQKMSLETFAAYLHLMYDSAFFSRLSTWANGLTVAQLPSPPKSDVSVNARRIANRRVGISRLSPKR